MKNSKELFASLIVKNAKDFSNENLKQDEVVELLTHDTSFKLMYKLCLEFSANVNELAESKTITLQAELEKAQELLKIIKDVERGLLFMQLPAEVREKLTTFLSEGTK